MYDLTAHKFDPKKDKVASAEKVRANPLVLSLRILKLSPLWLGLHDIKCQQYSSIGFANSAERFCNPQSMVIASDQFT